MCILVVAEPNTIPTREELIMGACSNPHGHGFALITNDGELVVNRSMKADTLIDEFLELREANMNGYAMFHSRYASHGEISLSNCHPFYLGDDKQSVLAHNGNFCNDLQPKGDDRSDTRWFAEDVMPSLGGITALDNPYLYEMISEWSGTNRVAFLTVNPEAEHELYLIGEKLGSVDEDGVWWSNQYHLNKSYAVGASSKFGSAKTLEPWETPLNLSEDEMDALTEKEWDQLLKNQTRRGFQGEEEIIKGVTQLEWTLNNGKVERGMETDPSGAFWFFDGGRKLENIVTRYVGKGLEDIKEIRILDSVEQ